MLCLHITEALVRRRARWESLCNHCGICCYEKTIRKGRAVINHSAPCRFLDTDKSCTIYQERFERCRVCRPMTLWYALFASYLPDSCGYVQAYRFWKRRRNS